MKKNKKNYAYIVRYFVKKEECKPPKNNIPEIKKTQEDEFIRSASQRILSTPMYQRLFYGNFFNFANFAHKVVNCRSYAKKRRNYAWYLNTSYPRRSFEEYNINQNSFGSLSNEVERYKCNNFGHIVKNCRLTIPPRKPKKNINRHISEPQEVWKRKQDQWSLALQAQHKKIHWYADIGCSKHMTGDNNKFLLSD
jgi:hypothetical protein